MFDFSTLENKAYILIGATVGTIKSLLQIPPEFSAYHIADAMFTAVLCALAAAAAKQLYDILIKPIVSKLLKSKK
jgi:hypothetical protein